MIKTFLYLERVKGGEGDRRVASGRKKEWQREAADSHCGRRLTFSISFKFKLLPLAHINSSIWGIFQMNIRRSRELKSKNANMLTLEIEIRTVYCQGKLNSKCSVLECKHWLLRSLGLELFSAGCDLKVLFSVLLWLIQACFKFHKDQKKLRFSLSPHFDPILWAEGFLSRRHLSASDSEKQASTKFKPNQV